MPLFLTIFEGATPATARPILAINDPAVMAAVRRLLLERLADAPVAKVSPLRPIHSHMKGKSRRPDKGQE